MRLRLSGLPARLAAMSCVVLIAAAAFAQNPQSEPQAEPDQPPVSRPSFFETIGRWLGDSKAMLDEQLKNTTDAAKEAAGAAGQATGTILGLPGTRVAIGRERCAVAPNGAPDCAAAADALCRSKGFGPGKSLDINTAQKCPTWVWLSGRPAPEGACVTETFVLRAMCR